MRVRLKTTPRLGGPGLVLSALMVALVGLASPAQAEKPQERYIFVLSRLELPEHAPAELGPTLRKQMAVAIGKSDHLSGSIPDDAPAYDEKDKGRYGNKAFHEYMAKNNLRAFKVTVQVTKHEDTLVPNPKKPGQILGSSIALRMFGETIPDRVMAFSGDGSASVHIEVGKKLKVRDRKFADAEAADLAIEEAVAMSLKKLEEKAPPPPKRKRRPRKRKKRPAQ